MNLRSQGYTASQIAESIGRGKTSTAIKLKRLTKKDNSYNSKHVIEKYEINRKFLDVIKPETVLDCFCGTKDFYRDFSRISNDKNENIPADFHEDAFKLCCRLYTEDKAFDLIDLDPFGSAYDCFDLAVKMAKKGLIITLGELGHKRWKRLDFVSTHYGIERLEDFTIDNLIAHIQLIGRRNKKNLCVFARCEWQNIGRVWFEIKPYKTVSQWEKTQEVKTEDDLFSYAKRQSEIP